MESFWYFMLTSEVPTMEQAEEVIEDFKGRAEVPEYVFDVLRAMPKDSHPMAMFSAAITAMQRESVFAATIPRRARQDGPVGADLRRRL